MIPSGIKRVGALGVLLGLVTMLALHGCPASGARLTVRVQSGLRAGDELRHVRAFLRRGGSCMDGEELRSEGRALERGDQLALGDGSLTVAELGPLEAGVYAVQVLGRRPGATGAESGPVLIERCVVTSITNDRVLRVALTTGCVGVTCPAPGGSAAFSECLNGRCVDPRCDPDDPITAPYCCDRALLGDVCDVDPTVCRTADDCERVAECTGDPSCEDGACIEPADDHCDEGQHCDVSMRACVPDQSSVLEDAGPIDAGAREDAGLDAGPVADAFTPFDAFVTPDAYFECRTGADCRDDGDVCTEVACVRGLCDTTTLACDDGVACTLDACSSPSGCQHIPDSSRCDVGATCHPTRGCEPADACTTPGECDDGLFCTVDACTGMRCANTARSCVADSSACTTTTCDETADACVHPFDPSSLTDPTHCGTSAAMCTAPCPSRANANATCSAGVCGFTCRAGFVDNDGLASNGCEYACTFMSSSDPADASGVDANCDGADGVAGSLDFIYVSPSGLSSGSGNRPSSAVNLARAFTVAAARGAPVTMLLVTGTYGIAGPLTATSGLTMVGGYQNTMYRTRAANSLVRSSDSIAMDVSVAATFDSVNFETIDQTVPGEYTRTLWVHGSSGLVLRNLTVTAGRGPAGVAGAAGAAGAVVGATGATGNPGTMSARGAGAGAGPGSGGDGASPPGAVGEGGTAGPCPGAGGGAGGGLLIGVCTCSSTVAAEPGQTGMPGCTGTTGSHSVGISGSGSIDSSGWAPPMMGTGTGGTGGVGTRGGGGGGGASADCSLGSAGGGGGGQGGAGGAGGLGGSPGEPGGGSFAILSFASALTLTNVTLVTRDGGDGGHGGSGGMGAAGGSGGSGGAGGSRNICGMGFVHGGMGGTGGVGGAGGPGGCGAGGVGGPAIGLFTAATTITPGATVIYTIGFPGIGGDACLSPPGGIAGADGVAMPQLHL